MKTGQKKYITLRPKEQLQNIFCFSKKREKDPHIAATDLHYDENVIQKFTKQWG